MISLTPQQQKLFAFIKHSISTNGVAPTQKEMARHIGTVSAGSVNRMLRDLEDRGWIIVHKYRSRAIEIVEAKCPYCGNAL